MAFQGLQVHSARLPTGDIPVVEVTLDPYVVLRRPDGTTVVGNELPSEGSAGQERYKFRTRWYRSKFNTGGHVCCVNPDREAKVQCILKLAHLKANPHLGYHCSTECFKSHWDWHKQQHEKAQREAGNEGPVKPGPDASMTTSSMHSNGETWVEVSRTQQYTPTSEDVGHVLKYECVVVDTFQSHGAATGAPFSLQTKRVRPAPTPPQRKMIPVNVPLPHSHGEVGARRFTVLTYNLLAGLYATPQMYAYCPSWALNWEYRKQNLVKELIQYNADILCLQEVQSDHYNDYLMRQLENAGYKPIYKQKTTEMYTGQAYAIDGCATFFRRDRFTMVKKYEVEFNKAAVSLAEGIPSPAQRKAALNRLLKDNVALIAVLEAVDMPASGTSRQLICIANTHIHANPELGDVKLWQVHTLLKGLEKIAASANIPMLVAGDFNSVPGSGPHQLLSQGKVAPGDPVLKADPLQILNPVDKLQHQLPLRSAYAAMAHAAGDAPRAAEQRSRCGEHGEPKFSNVTRDFTDTLDYIFYTHDSLAPTSLMELPALTDFQPRPGVSGLPNATWSSDHIALMAEFKYIKMGA